MIPRHGDSGDRDHPEYCSGIAATAPWATQLTWACLSVPAEGSGLTRPAGYGSGHRPAGPQVAPRAGRRERERIGHS
jgi:hypothetical protein